MTNSTLHQTLLGFDFGTRSIGVAVGQTITQSARPLLAISAENGLPNWTDIEKLLKEWRPAALVVGLPYDMQEEATASTHAAQRFANRLRERFGLPVHLIDEKLSSREARQHLSSKSRAPSKAEIDAVSACIILESWLRSQ